MRAKDVEELAEVAVDLEKLSIEEQLDIVADAVHTLAERFEEQGIAFEVVSGAVFRVFAERMCDANDRDTYEEILEEALDSPWDEVTIH